MFRNQCSLMVNDWRCQMSSKGDPGHGHVIYLTGHGLTIEDAVLVARGDANGVFPRVELHPEARDHMAQMRAEIEKKIEAREVMYGINTGCGSNKDIALEPEELDRYQRKYIKTHAVGFGDFVDPEVIRVMMLLRVNSFAVGNSGVTLGLCNSILELLNRNIIPAVPKYGSVGASGDLIPLAHLGAVLIGRPWAKVFFNGDLRDANTVLLEEGLIDEDHDTLHELSAKEAMGLTNGATYILSLAVLGVYDAQQLVELSDLGVALHLEAVRGELNAFDDRVHLARQHQGQISAAAHIRGLVKDSHRTTKKAQAVMLPFDSCPRDDAPCAKKCPPKEDGKQVKGPRVQDRYSVRCAPQVHGAVRQAITHLASTVVLEMNASTDNPLIFPSKKKPGDYDVLSAGNFHGEILAIPIDGVLIALANLANISNARLYALLEDKRSYGLPNDLSGGEEQDNTGFMIAQYSVAGLVMQMMGLAAGHSRFSIPTSAGQEDYVSNGANAALALRESLGFLEKVLAVEILAGCQAIDLGTPHLGEEHSKLGAGTQLAYDLVREHVAKMGEDDDLYPDIHDVLALVEDGTLHAEISDL